MQSTEKSYVDVHDVLRKDEVRLSEMCEKGGMMLKLHDFHPGRSPATNGGVPIQIRAPRLVMGKYFPMFEML
jgi:hypothetical protein